MKGRWAVLGTLLLLAALGIPRLESLRTDWERSVEETLYQALYEGQEQIRLSRYGLDEETFRRLWDALLCDRPELFYVSDTYEYIRSGDRVVSVHPSYRMAGDGLLKARADWRLALEDYLAGVEDDWTAAETALYLHDRLTARCTYDETGEGRDAYGLLTGGTGVCQAYSMACLALFREAGLDCRYVRSTAMEHAWVQVEIDGVWYHVDATFDDPTVDRLGRVRHDYFLVSDEKLLGDHYGLEDAVPCPSTAYDDAPWTTAESAFVSVDGVLYAIAGGWLCRWDDGVLTPLEEIPDRWYTADGTAYWEGCYAVLDTDGRLLYYNTPDAILAYDPATGTGSTVCVYDGPGDLYGFRLGEDGSFLCQIGDDPNEPGTLARLILS